MASGTYNASTLKTSASDSSWRTDTSNAYQGLWIDGTSYSNKRIGYIGFSSSMGTTMSTSSISSIDITMTATASGMGSTSTKTIYFYKYNSSGTTPATQRGDQLGTVSGTGFYSATKTITCSSSSNSTLFNNLKSYLESGNYVLMIYAPNDTSVLSGYSCSANYVGFSAVSLKITYTPKYTLTLNKGTGISSVSGAGTYASGTSVSASATPSTGYNFTKWTSSSSASAAAVSTANPYTFTLSSNTTLYAQATLKTYTITYNVNGGSGGPSNQTKTHGTTLTLSSTKPTRTGYVFKEWNTSSGGTGTAYAAGASFTTNANTTLYAIWTPYVLTVIYNANSGTQASGNAYPLPYTTTANYGTNYNGTSGLWNISTFGLTRTGYTANRWNTSASGTGKTIDETTSYTAQDLASVCGYNLGTGNVTVNLYPMWVANTYTVVYNGNGATGGSTATTIHTYGVSAPLSTNGFSRTGHVFKEWNTKADGTGTPYTSGQSVSNLTSTNNGTVTLYAIWTAWTYTIRYYPNGGTGTSYTSSHTYGVSSTLTPNKFTRENYTFLGWSTSTAGAVVYQDGATAPSDITENGEVINLYAVWAQDSPWTLSMVYINIDGSWKMF